MSKQLLVIVPLYRILSKALTSKTYPQIPQKFIEERISRMITEELMSTTGTRSGN